MTENWLPTPENINALPEPVRRYIHDVETRCDPAGDVQRLVLAEDTVRALELVQQERDDAVIVLKKVLEVALAMKRRLEA